MSLNLLDWFIVLMGLSVVYAAAKRGLRQEIAQTFIFALFMCTGWLIFSESLHTTSTKQDAAILLINFGYFTIFMYLFSLVIMKFGVPILLAPVPIRGAFWAVLVAGSKFVGTLLALNMWWAVHSNDAHPLRLNILPTYVRESAIIQLSDQKTEEIYRWVATKGWLTYSKYVERKETEKEKAMRHLEELMGMGR